MSSRPVSPAAHQMFPFSAQAGKSVPMPSEPVKKNEIYLGFAKDDYKPKAGRKGRVVEDDPTKYPDKDEFSGGWAGGEVGLQSFVQEVSATQDVPKYTTELKDASREQEGTVVVKFAGKKVKARDLKGGEDLIYVGFEKEVCAANEIVRDAWSRGREHAIG